MSPRPLLIVGHPGHELLLHGWLSEARPLVMVLTDGSGLAGRPRIGQSLQVIRDAGAAAAAVFGYAPDNAFYAALLKRDAAFFAPLVEAATLAIEAEGAVIVVSDAVEHVEPVH